MGIWAQAGPILRIFKNNTHSERGNASAYSTRVKIVMHFGFNKKEIDYILGNQKLNAVEEERFLGVIVDKSLKSNRQCVKAAAAANAVLGMIR